MGAGMALGEKTSVGSMEGNLCGEELIVGFIRVGANVGEALGGKLDVIDGSEVGDIAAEAGCGVFVGASVCHAEGCQVWSNVSTEGTMVRSGTGDGANDGPAVTISVGGSVGAGVGPLLGANEGLGVGTLVGSAVGLTEGTQLGRLVGEVVGKLLGTKVGVGVGTSEGVAVGT